MHLYHFTSKLHLPYIKQAGYLRPSDSNIDPFTPHAGPRVVWLLDTPELDAEHGLNARKTEIRFTVDHPLAVKWTDWGPGLNMDPDWREILVETGGGWAAADHWYVVAGQIRASKWVSIDDLTSN